MSRRRWMAPLMLASLLSACQGDPEPTPGDPNPTDAGAPTDAGTPADAGTPDAGSPYDGLVFNEVVAAGDPDWFELYNAGPRTVDLQGVTFSDNRTTPGKARFDAGTTLAPGAFLRVNVSDDLTGFALSSDEELALFTPTRAAIALLDWNEGDSPRDKSYGRIPNGTGAFKTLNTPTPGAANLDNGVCGNGTAERDEVCDGTDLHGATCQSLGYVSGTLSCGASCQLDTQRCVSAMADTVINELTSSGDDRIELYNRGTGPADLTGWFVADRDYDVSTGTPLDKRYVLNATLAAGEYLVLVKGQNHPFGIGKNASTLRLFNKNNLQVDIAAWANGAAEISFCRRPNGTGDFVTCAAQSFGAANP